jgi:intron-binding protein aquarius
MTGTQARIKRKELIQLGFEYNNFLIDDASQILEMETFISVHMQKQERVRKNLERVVLIGEHHQLPPVVQNVVLRSFSHFDQSLFLRLLKLGLPFIPLNFQGRCRPTLAKLFSWRYRQIKSSSSVLKNKFTRTNPGFLFEYQLINVLDDQGICATETVPYMYENSTEAEYIISVYQYMRLHGYCTQKIVILSTYNGQVALIRNMIENRCSQISLIGRPVKISTIDNYQGLQSEFVLISLVKNHNLGHVKDVRRLILAMSRSRLGLYVFARAPLFNKCYEAKQVFQRLFHQPTTLALTPYKNKTLEGRSRTGAEHVTIPNIFSMAYFVIFIIENYY